MESPDPSTLMFWGIECPNCGAPGCLCPCLEDQQREDARLKRFERKSDDVPIGLFRLDDELTLWEKFKQWLLG